MACWFTASTTFANPSVTLTRAFTVTFSWTRLANVPTFIFSQTVGAVIAIIVIRWVLAEPASPQTK
ncbi:aquaporin [Lysobacter sp. K5869]|nr:aquaporin [Lysobacter sp. K5869]